MDAQKISIKLFVENDCFGPAEFVPVFHRWIQDHVLEDHLLIDVADYGHVADGPGTLLVSQEANIHMDRTGGRLGLLYFRKRALPGSFSDRLGACVDLARRIAEKLEAEPALAGRLKFRTDELSIKLNDRLAAPNSPETFAAVRADIERLARHLYGSVPVSIAHAPNEHELFEAVIRAASAMKAETAGV